jgi:hypothetical protein
MAGGGRIWYNGGELWLEISIEDGAVRNKVRLKIGAPAMCLLLLAAGLSEARTIAVGPGGGYDFDTIQAAIEAATGGDTVLLADGVYRGPGNRDIDFLGKAVTVRSENGPQHCVVDCNGTELEAHRGFVFQSGEDANSLLEGVTVRNGWVLLYGGGVYCRQSGPRIVDCIFSGNRSYKLGGGLYVETGDPQIVDCTFSGNFAQDGAGAFAAACNPTLQRCVFTGNRAEQDGGGMCLSICDGLLADCSFAGNYAIYGGGLHSYRSEPELVNCVFAGNSAEAGGGLLNYGGALLVSGCAFSENRADGGGGIYNSYSEVTASDCVLTGNQAIWAGGMENYKSTAAVRLCRFSGNRGTWGGAMRNYNSIVTARNCIFSGNIADIGGGVYSRDSTELEVTNCSFVRNSAAQGRALACDSHGQKYPGSFAMSSCIVRNGADELWNGDGSTIVVVCSNVEGGRPGEGNIDADPFFACLGYWDPNRTPQDANDDFWVEGDYHLRSEGGRWEPTSRSWVLDDVTSPCIDAGDMAGALGWEAFPNGGRVNMGAYGGTGEASKSYFGSPGCRTIIAGDINGDCRVDFVDLAFIAAGWAGQR